MIASTGPDDLRDALARHGAAFEARFGGPQAARLFFAPGRVNLFGAHLDYNGGPVMPTAIDRGTYFAFRQRADRRVRMAALREPESFEGTLEALPDAPLGRWYDYPLGVVRAAHGRFDGPGFDLLVGGNLPIGAGLSSSASICVGTAFALARMGEWGHSAIDGIRLALAAERGFVGVQCGIMDPYAVGLARPGHLLWLDCKDESFEHVPLDYETVSIGVADTGVRRELAQSEFNRRVAQCRAAFEILAPHAGPEVRCLRDVSAELLAAHAGELAPDLRARARHVVSEVARAFAARDALRAGDTTTMGRLMLATQVSLREDYDVSCPELDVIVESASAASGVFGARLTGAGFGGCAVVLLRRGCEAEAREAIERGFEARFGRRPPVAFYRGDEGPREIEL